MKNRLIIGFVVALILIIVQEVFSLKGPPASTWELNSQVTWNSEVQVNGAGTSTPALLTRVVDGDTIVVLVNGVSEKVRLIGVDTPESVDPRRTVECFGKEASAFTTSILLNKNVVLEPDETQNNRDKYGRLLRYVFLGDGTLVNKEIISNGYGHEYTYLFPYKYQNEFKQTQVEAKELKKGLWADGACTGKRVRILSSFAIYYDNTEATMNLGHCDFKRLNFQLMRRASPDEPRSFVCL